jgi:glycosyltransferase involved in cell wall biosynthesis
VFEELFDRVEKMFPRVTIKIVSDEKPKLFGESIKWEKWEEKKELEQLLSFDIGIMPLVSNPWTMGKCGFKIIQYMAAGIPVICSPVGTNIEIIKNGDNGFCADNIPQWQEAISKLISDVHLYKAMSIAGRQTVEKYYNLSSWGPHFAKQIKKCIECHSPLSSLLGGEKG